MHGVIGHPALLPPHGAAGLLHQRHPFNLLGIDEWVRNFHFINYIDCFDGSTPTSSCRRSGPIGRSPASRRSTTTSWSTRRSWTSSAAQGRGGQAVFLFFDEQTEQLCREFGLEICFPPARLRQQVDNKLETTRIGDRAGVRSVPHVLTKVESWTDLRRVSRELGHDLVVQTAFGDSGHTTFFIKSEADWKKHADEIVAEPEVKVMRRVSVRGSALEACVTREGTIVGPLMTELIGFKELTPYRGGWCGNEVLAEAFPRAIRDQARDASFQFGAELGRLGYTGYFELDFLIERNTGELFLGEVNPRITGASAMTNLAAFAHADAPLFLFHLLQWAKADFDLDVAALNRRWSDPANIDPWGQLVIKHTSDTTEVITAAPPSGVWRLDGDGVHFVRSQTHRRTVESESEAFFLRIAREGDYKYEGADLGILITPGRLMTKGFRLNARAKAWTEGILAQYRSRRIRPADVQVAAQPVDVGNFKLL